MSLTRAFCSTEAKLALHITETDIENQTVYVTKTAPKLTKQELNRLKEYNLKLQIAKKFKVSIQAKIQAEPEAEKSKELEDFARRYNIQGQALEFVIKTAEKNGGDLEKAARELGLYSV